MTHEEELTRAFETSDWFTIARILIHQNHNLDWTIGTGIVNKHPTYYLIMLSEQWERNGNKLDEFVPTAANYDHTEFLAWLMLKGANPNHRSEYDDKLHLTLANLPGMQILLAAQACVTTTALEEKLKDYSDLTGYGLYPDYGEHEHEQELADDEEYRQDCISVPHQIALLLRYGANPYRQGLIHRVFNKRYRSMLERAGVMPILLSAHMVPRVGCHSPLRVLPVEVVRLVGAYIWHTQ